MKKEDVAYEVNGVKLVGKVVYDESVSGKRPAVIVAHAFEGRNDLAIEYAEKCAKLGYVGFALDMYGNGEVFDSFEVCAKHYMECFQNRKMCRERTVGALETVRSLDQVDPDNIAAIGFCFGGLCVLELARSGADIKGAVAVHGVWAKSDVPTEAIKAEILCVHGYKDPQVPPDQLGPFAEEMDAAGADWEVVFYGNAKHAFTDPHAAELGPKEAGRVYDPKASKRAWIAASNLFEEVFQ